MYEQRGIAEELSDDDSVEPAAGEGLEEITRWLGEWSHGDPRALDRLLPRIYDELRKLASTYLGRERAGHTLQTSDLVHEAFLRLLRQQHVDWESRTHFFGIAARMMRRILVDHARAFASGKRGGKLPRMPFDDATMAVEAGADLVALDDALRDLEAASPEQARVVELRYFAGLPRDEVAALLRVSVPTVTRRWRVARAWLYRHLTGGERDDR